MKKVYTTALTLGLAVIAHAQVPNASFENWNGSVPESWSVNNIAPLNFHVITPDADAHSGALAARGEVKQNPVIPSQVVSPTMQTSGVPVTQDPPAVTGRYKFAPTQSTTNFVIGVTVIDINGGVTGTGTAQYFDAQSGYTPFSVPINYDIGGNDPAASVTISFIIADDVPNGALGSWFLVDDVALDGAQGMNEHGLTTASVGEAYPSPFVHSTTVPVSLGYGTQLRAEVMDILGRSVQVLADRTMRAGDHAITWIPAAEVANGVYFLRLSDGSTQIAKRMVLQR